MNLLLDYAERIGQICPECGQGVITPKAVERCVQFKAPKVMCEGCLKKLLQEVVRKNFQQKPGYRQAPPKHKGEKPRDDEISYRKLLNLLEVPSTTLDQLINAGHLDVRNLNNHHKERVIPKEDVRKLTELMELMRDSGRIDGLGPAANGHLFSQYPVLVERVKSALT